MTNIHSAIVIIPALNEEDSIAKVINDIPEELVDAIILVDNGSEDNTAKNAKNAGAVVVYEPERGYGAACLKGMEYIRTEELNPDVVVFIDADYSDHPEEMPNLLEPIYKDEADMVIGSRDLGLRESGSMTYPQIFGNWLATRLIRIFYGVRFTDLGPFRSIRYRSLLELEMKDRNFGWTVEMQVKAAKNKIRTTEVAVNYRKRIGVSKVSGTIKGTILAGYKILLTIFKYA